MAMSKRTKEAIDGALSLQVADGNVGLGVDMVEIARMRTILKRTPSFRVKVFTEAERAYCEDTADPAVHYATRFAAKEAVVKALGTGFSRGIGVQDIEIRRQKSGRPVVALGGEARRIATELGVTEIPVSLSYTHKDAIACAIAITQDSIDQSAKRIDPTEELARRFKEARTMLDDLD